jgi:hypothetical protein
MMGSACQGMDNIDPSIPKGRQLPSDSHSFAWEECRLLAEPPLPPRPASGYQVVQFGFNLEASHVLYPAAFASPAIPGPSSSRIPGTAAVQRPRRLTQRARAPLIRGNRDNSDPTSRPHAAAVAYRSAPTRLRRAMQMRAPHELQVDTID